MKKTWLFNCIAYLSISVIILGGAALPAYLLGLQQDSMLGDWAKHSVPNIVAYPSPSPHAEEDYAAVSTASVDFDTLVQSVSAWGARENHSYSRDTAGNELTMEEAVACAISQVEELILLGAVPAFDIADYTLSRARLFCPEDAPYSAGRWSIAFQCTDDSNHDFQVVLDSLDGRVFSLTVPYSGSAPLPNRLEMLLAFGRYHGLLDLEMDMQYRNISELQSELTIDPLTLQGQFVRNENGTDVFRYTTEILLDN